MLAALAGLQALATIALRPQAVGGWVRLVPQATARRIDDAVSAYRLPPLLRLVLARDALARGDVARAARDAALLRPSNDRSTLLAGIARSRGELDVASRDDLAALDLPGISADVAALVARRRFSEALALERAAVARLANERTQADVLARASFELGALEETQSYQLWYRSERRAAHKRASLEAYERAASLAPFDVGYLLATANQALNVGDFGVARRFFERAARIDPRSADPIAGLGDLALRRGDAALARRELARARAIDPASATAARLARKLDR